MLIKSKKDTLQTGEIIPELLLNGDTERIRLKTNQKTALIFVSTYCLYCIDLLPFLAEIEKDFPYNLILFSTGEIEDNKEMKEYFAWDFPIISMDESKIKSELKVTAFPYTLIIDENGTITNQGVIYNYDDFKFLTDKIIKG